MSLGIAAICMNLVIGFMVYECEHCRNWEWITEYSCLEALADGLTLDSILQEQVFKIPHIQFSVNTTWQRGVHEACRGNSTAWQHGRGDVGFAAWQEDYKQYKRVSAGWFSWSTVKIWSSSASILQLEVQLVISTGRGNFMDAAWRFECNAETTEKYSQHLSRAPEDKQVKQITIISSVISSTHRMDAICRRIIGIV